ncbi:MAG: aldehyde dehydrogenase [Neisseriaceae bacterium]|nr:aldehyde dehydrogenase [Neisseriaceae bacterium]MBP6861578.1 aldehyde dehydrogenase [Neisseriaceae bacterium]
MSVTQLVAQQRQFFMQQHTKPYAFRAEALKRLAEAFAHHEADCYAALAHDLNKSESEAYMSEMALIQSELAFVRRRLAKWMRPKRLPTPLSHQPGRSRQLFEPYGVVLIMAPWNYPLLLNLSPLIGALAAGNCCILKPSPDAPATSAVLQKIIERAFPPEHVACIEGGIPLSNALMAEPLDYVFFTGGEAGGKAILRQAAERLIPVTLELGGKSPCIVDTEVDLKVTARRIVFGKWLNAGQTCVAPDYLLVAKSQHSALMAELEAAIIEAYGPEPLANPDYPKIINQRHFDRLTALLPEVGIVHGGHSQADALKIAPTVVDVRQADSALMADEIFGPILPVLTYNHLDEAIAQIQSRPKPLALYVFSSDQDVVDRVLSQCSSGGACVNDTIMHLANIHLPFGGVGPSGMGHYHGHSSFLTFSHQKSLYQRGFRFELPLRFAPFSASKLKWLKRFL